MDLISCRDYNVYGVIPVYLKMCVPHRCPLQAQIIMVHTATKTPCLEAGALGEATAPAVRD